MRLAFVMTIGVCWLCLQFNQCIQLLRPGSDGRPICSQPPVTRAEIDAALAARLERLQADSAGLGEKPAVAMPLTLELASRESGFQDDYVD